MKILDMREAERPREKMIQRGPGALSDTEILAVLIQTGTKEESAIDIAGKLLDSTGGSLRGLAAYSMEALIKTKGIGQRKAATVKAALELGRRFFAENENGRVQISSAEDVCSLMEPSLKGLGHEECWVLLLNNSHRLIGKIRASSGGDSSTVMEAKQILRMAVEGHASGIIVVHNHPGGSPKPSRADISSTEKLTEACSALGIALIDHVILGEDGCYSFAGN